MNEAEISRLIEPILVETLGTSGLERFTVRAAEDHHGEPSLFVDAYFAGREKQVDAHALLAAVGAMRDLLEEKGDRRFPYLLHHTPDPEQGIAA